jgi:putative transferase (TIGR04331 family)
VEGFERAYREMKKGYPDSPCAIFSNTAWQFDEVFKQWAASCAENGVILLGSQHGGTNGSLANLATLDHEIEITDRYYTWGWEGSGDSKKIIPFYAARLVGMSGFKADNKTDGILYVLMDPPRYLPAFPFFIDFSCDYIKWQFMFLDGIFPDLMPKLRVRFSLSTNSRKDYGWELPERWKDAWPDVAIDDNRVPFLESLNNCRIYVCDHMGTTFTEALSGNKPSILFWNPKFNRLTSEAQYYYDILRKAEILHDSPEGAAYTLNHVYDDVEGWWNETGRQETRMEFCERFARTSKNAVNMWLSEFKRITRMRNGTGHLSGILNSG